ncbi:MAG TPA: phosphoribosylformylglycinamidine cyclo-ligase [Thermoplasmata archaeon]|nr:phosphoribosylformylglycinamidine cyclo-ligase [Thermoplasmata archaeon]
MGAPSAPGWTYARSGVDRSSVAASLARLLSQIRSRPKPSHGRALDLPGHYAGLVRIGRETIAITTDTVGTKGLLAEEVGDWEGVGEDIVAVNVNDLASVGARPSALVDCLSISAPSPEAFEQIGRGLDRGLRASGMSLLGGETAVVPELVHGYDLGGTAIGFFPKGRRPVTGALLRPGDRVIGIPSNGVHANGMTLVRRLLREHHVDLARPRPGGMEPIGRELLRPTRIYSPQSEALAGRPEVQAFAHISGGGVRNLARLSARVAFVLDGWPPVPALFRWIQELGGISPREMFETFNMGIGFAVVVRPHRLSETLRRLARSGAADAVLLGRVERGAGVRLPSHDLVFHGYSEPAAPERAP